jgi:YHS domain-containing protein
MNKQGGTDDTSGAWGDDPRVQEALDPNNAGSALGNGPMARDPVCGTLVDTRTAQNTLPAPVGSHKRTLYFDSPECKALYEANPEQYAANV